MHDDDIETRKNAAGRFGFALGCVAAILAFGVTLTPAEALRMGQALIEAATLARAEAVPR